MATAIRRSRWAHGMAISTSRMISFATSLVGRAIAPRVSSHRQQPLTWTAMAGRRSWSGPNPAAYLRGVPMAQTCQAGPWICGIASGRRRACWPAGESPSLAPASSSCWTPVGGRSRAGRVLCSAGAMPRGVRRPDPFGRHPGRGCATRFPVRLRHPRCRRRPCLAAGRRPAAGFPGAAGPATPTPPRR